MSCSWPRVRDSCRLFLWRSFRRGPPAGHPGSHGESPRAGGAACQPLEIPEENLLDATNAILVSLVTHAGQLVPKEHLLEAVWPETVVSEGVLKSCIAELRKVLGETAQRPQYIATVSRRGYRFIAPVTAVSRPPEHADRASSPCDPAETPAPPPLGRGGGHLADAETTRTLAVRSTPAEAQLASPDPSSVVPPPPVIADRPSLVACPSCPCRTSGRMNMWPTG
jgi:hypothetical protein